MEALCEDLSPPTPGGAPETDIINISGNYVKNAGLFGYFSQMADHFDIFDNFEKHDNPADL